MSEYFLKPFLIIMGIGSGLALCKFFYELAVWNIQLKRNMDSGLPMYCGKCRD